MSPEDLCNSSLEVEGDSDTFSSLDFFTSISGGLSILIDWESFSARLRLASSAFASLSLSTVHRRWIRCLLQLFLNEFFIFGKIFLHQQLIQFCHTHWNVTAGNELTGLLDSCHICN